MSSTYNNGPGNVPRLPDRVVDTLIDSAGVSRCAPGRGITVIDQTAAIEALVHGVCEELLARLPAPADPEQAKLDSLAQAGLAAALESHAKGEETGGAQVLLPCPFCCSTNIDPAEWSGNDGKSGPGCGDCGALAESVADWNRRATIQPTARPAAEVVRDAMGFWEFDPLIPWSQMPEGTKLYTGPVAPADAVRDARNEALARDKVVLLGLVDFMHDRQTELVKAIRTLMGEGGTYPMPWDQKCEIAKAAITACAAPTKSTSVCAAPLAERTALEAIFNQLDPHRDAVLWGIASDALNFGRAPVAERAAAHASVPKPAAREVAEQALQALSHMQGLAALPDGRNPRDVLRAYIQMTSAAAPEAAQATASAGVVWAGGVISIGPLGVKFPDGSTITAEGAVTGPLAVGMAALIEEWGARQPQKGAL